MVRKSATEHKFGNKKQQRKRQLIEARVKRWNIADIGHSRRNKSCSASPSTNVASELQNLQTDSVNDRETVTDNSITFEDRNNDAASGVSASFHEMEQNDGSEQQNLNTDSDRETVTDNSVADGNGNNDGVSASFRKISKFHNLRMEQNDGNHPYELEDVQRVGQSDFLLADLNQINILLSKVLCPECLTEDSLKVRKCSKAGFSVELVLSCSGARCNFSASEHSSARIGKSKKRNVAFEVNERAVILSHELGKGHSALEKIAATFGMDNMHLKTYQRLDKKVTKAYISCGEEVLASAALLVRKCYMSLDESIAENDTVDIMVSYDGTWQKRGFTSHYGIGTLIEVLTGYCIDFEVLSTYCHACALAQKAGTDTVEWKVAHEPDCCKNYSQSSKSMEQAAAVKIWGRSLAKYNFRYSRMISDGDSSAFRSICAAQPYGNDIVIEKYECVNHCHKRMGTALRDKAKQARLGGKGYGRLTKEKCTSLQNFYRGAIINNLNDTVKMRNAIWATLFHCLSTDDEPHHTRCPAGADSWCRWKRAEAKGEEAPSHRTHLKSPLLADVARELVPIYERMSDPNLLQKLSHGKTQNANESLNNIIWVNCPKTVFVGKRRVDAAAASAVHKFNEGALHLSKVMENLAIEPSELTMLAAMREDTRRVEKANRQAQETFIKRRKLVDSKKKKDVARQEDEEGPTYGPGQF